MTTYKSSYSGIIDNIYDSVPLARNNRIRQIKTFVNPVKVTYNDVNFNYSFINENSDIIQLFYSNGEFRSEVKAIERKLYVLAISLYGEFLGYYCQNGVLSDDLNKAFRFQSDSKIQIILPYLDKAFFELIPEK